MSEAKTRTCPVCGKVFEVVPRSRRKYCTRACLDKFYSKEYRDYGLAYQQSLRRNEAAQRARRRRQMFDRRDAEYAKLGVRVVVAQREGGGHIERRGMVGGGCCVGSTTGFNPRPFDLRIFKP